MSLIEEALKRQQQESSGGETAASPTRAAHLRPLSPPDPPAVKRPEADKKESSRALPTVAIVLGVLVVVLCAGLFMVYSAYRQWGGIVKKAVEAPPVEMPAASTTAVEQAAAGPAPAAEPEQGQLRQAAEAAQPASEQARGAVPVTAPDTGSGPAPTAPKPVVSAPEQDTERAEPPPPAREPVVWPRVAVSGIVQNPRFASAQINGKVLGIGESTDGITLVSVENQGAWLEFRDDRKFFKVRAAQ